MRFCLIKVTLLAVLTMSGFNIASSQDEDPWRTRKHQTEDGRDIEIKYYNDYAEVSISGSNDTWKIYERYWWVKDRPKDQAIADFYDPTSKKVMVAFAWASGWCKGIVVSAVDINDGQQYRGEWILGATFPPLVGERYHVLDVSSNMLKLSRTKGWNEVVTVEQDGTNGKVKFYVNRDEGVCDIPLVKQ